MLSIHSSPLGRLGTRDTGGMSVYIRQVSRELGRMGHRVDIFTRRTVAKQEPVIALGENVRLIHLNGGNGSRSGKTALYYHLVDFFHSLEGFRREHILDYDVIHSHYWLSGSLGRRAQDGWKRPHAITFHTLGAVKNSTGVGKQEPFLRITTEKRLTAQCHRILSTTEKDKQQLIRLYGAPSDKVGIVPCGVDLSLFRPHDKAAARRRLGFAPDEPVILYVGRFEPLKGIDRLLAAAACLRSETRFCLLLVGGDGPETPESRRLRKMTSALGLLDAVSFVGRIDQEQLPPYYSAADVLVVPSHYESFGLVGLEAMACGTPVVATPVGAMESIVRPGYTGQLVADAGPLSLAQAITTVLFKTPGFSAADISASVGQFGWTRVAEKLAGEYETLCGVGEAL